MTKSDKTHACAFDFTPPPGYDWLLERGLIGYDPPTPLQPWHYLDKKTSFEVTKRWPNRSSKKRLVAFAKRQDNDDVACFRIDGNKTAGIVLIHGWTTQGYEVVCDYVDFWGWLKAVVDDIAEWSSVPHYDGNSKP